MKFVAITSCPTGIAHTYMAAEGLEQAAQEAGHEIVVETQGSAGSAPLDPAVIAEADAAIIAADVGVSGKERFAHIPIIEAGVKEGISNGPGLIAQAVAAAEAHKASGLAKPAAAPSAAPAAGGPATKVTAGAHLGTKLRQWLMTGVSYIIPFVAAGGLLIAIAFALGNIALGDEGYTITSYVPEGQTITDVFEWGSLASWAALCLSIGSVAFGFLVPVLGGFIAYAMADRPAIAPGFVAGAIANSIGAGFIGGLVGGLLAGAVVLWMRKYQVPKSMRGIMPVVVYPLVATFIVGALMYVVIGKPIAAVTEGLTDWLNGLSGANAILLGVLLGAMMGFDMGGPVNKTAYAFALAGLSTQTEASQQIMAAVMAAGMVPPLALALATVLRPKEFTEIERENGKSAWVLGASFITEGAIPFAAADPLRVIPSIVAGSAVAGGLTMAFACTLPAPHGGIFVVPLMGNPILYLVAIAAGMVVACALVIVLKGAKGEKEAAELEQAVPAAAGTV